MLLKCTAKESLKTLTNKAVSSQSTKTRFRVWLRCHDKNHDIDRICNRILENPARIEPGPWENPAQFEPGPQENSVHAEMCSERDSPLKRLYRRTHAKLTRLAGSGQLVWAADCELSLALVHARRPAWPGETSETILRMAPPRKTRPPDHTRVNWPVDASASGSAQVGPGGRHRWAARVQVGQEPARQKAREGYPSHYTSLVHERTRPIENAINVAVNCWKLVCSVQLFKVHQFCTQNRYSS